MTTPTSVEKSKLFDTKFEKNQNVQEIIKFINVRKRLNVKLRQSESSPDINSTLVGITVADFFDFVKRSSIAMRSNNVIDCCIVCNVQSKPRNNLFVSYIFSC